MKFLEEDDYDIIVVSFSILFAVLSVIVPIISKIITASVIETILSGGSDCLLFDLDLAIKILGDEKDYCFLQGSIYAICCRRYASCNYVSTSKVYEPL
ncbi:hypothetical protein BCR32DRAFT_291778 [Anaeromyces robustus]|uniref:Uncharacterized protein n=1 Tax=Anaeromyces robustus TaxID=1754192 RepID=A0A1Y1XDI9_9FUNG|nr:hypothetical protein BCR32DRAFT_291778 [Anaeromyces robustus]|eukprot:ORX83795.1 hypothetical protein BCR32DRAFT_291778 [Anaeromyces robustus]